MSLKIVYLFNAHVQKEFKFVISFTDHSFPYLFQNKTHMVLMVLVIKQEKYHVNLAQMSKMGSEPSSSSSSSSSRRIDLLRLMVEFQKETNVRKKKTTKNRTSLNAFCYLLAHTIKLSLLSIQARNALLQKPVFKMSTLYMWCPVFFAGVFVAIILLRNSSYWEPKTHETKICFNACIFGSWISNSLNFYKSAFSFSSSVHWLLFIFSGYISLALDSMPMRRMKKKLRLDA